MYAVLADDKECVEFVLENVKDPTFVKNRTKYGDSALIFSKLQEALEIQKILEEKMNELKESELKEEQEKDKTRIE